MVETGRDATEEAWTRADAGNARAMHQEAWEAHEVRPENTSGADWKRRRISG